MPSVCRRIAVLLVLACLGAVLPCSLAAAQGAGDQQYQDPFGSSTQSSSGAKKHHPSSSSATPPTLSPTPQTPGGSAGGGSGSGGSGSAGTQASAPAPAAAPASGAAAAGLPNTGADARVLLLAGALLLLTGIGLRLRTAPERF